MTRRTRSSSTRLYYLSVIGPVLNAPRGTAYNWPSYRSVSRRTKLAPAHGNTAVYGSVRRGSWQMPYNFATDSFHTKKLCSRLSSSEVRFFTQIGYFAFFRQTLGDLGATYDDHLRLIGKRVVDFLLALIEVFSLGVTAKALRAIIGWKWAILLQWGPVDPKFQVEGAAPTNHSSSQKTRLNALSYGI